MDKGIRILIADDHPIYRDGLCRIVEKEPALELVHETGDGKDALEKAHQLRPDILLLDIQMPRMTGLEIARARFKENLPYKIVLLTNYEDEATFNEAMDLGVNGYILKECVSTELKEALFSIARGDYYVSPSLSGFLLKNRNTQSKPLSSGLDSLTASELRILKLIASDMTTKEIAAKLGLSPKTVENHRSNMSAKLGLTGSHSLLKFAFENKGKL